MGKKKKKRKKKKDYWALRSPPKRKGEIADYTTRFEVYEFFFYIYFIFFKRAKKNTGFKRAKLVGLVGLLDIGRDGGLRYFFSFLTKGNV